MRMPVKKVEALLKECIDWLAEDKQHLDIRDFLRLKGIRYANKFLKEFEENYPELMDLLEEITSIVESKLIKIGIFEKINQNFLIALMRSRYGWRDDDRGGVNVNFNIVVQEAKKKVLDSANTIDVKGMLNE